MRMRTVGPDLRAGRFEVGAVIPNHPRCAPLSKGQLGITAPTFIS